MLFLDLVQETRQLNLTEIRKNDDGYFECVIPVRHEKELYPLFERFFGPPFKPKNVPPDERAQAVSYDYGGIEKHQILYYTERDGLSNCALIWPWNNGLSATVKLAQGRIKKEGNHAVVE